MKKIMQSTTMYTIIRSFSIFSLFYLSIYAWAQNHEYIIQSNDTLYSIARQFSVTVEDIARINKIDNISVVHIGQKIIIPNQQNNTRTQTIPQINPQQTVQSIISDTQTTPMPASSNDMPEISDSKLMNIQVPDAIAPPTQTTQLPDIKKEIAGTYFPIATLSIEEKTQEIRRNTNNLPDYIIRISKPLLNVKTNVYERQFTFIVNGEMISNMPVEYNIAEKYTIDVANIENTYIAYTITIMPLPLGSSIQVDYFDLTENNYLGGIEMTKSSAQ